MPFIQTAGLRIHYEQAGSGPESIVLVHGNFASWRWWQSVLNSLPDGVQAFAPDLRGCGASEKPFEGYEIPRLAQDLAAFADGLGLSCFHLVGHSLGGAVALQFALDHGQRLRRLVLAAPTPAEGLSTHMEQYPDSLVSITNLSRWLPSIALDQVFLNQVLSHVFPDQEGAIDIHALTEDALRISPVAAAAFTQALNSWKIQTELDRIQTPTLIIGGAKDPLVHPDALERTAAGLPDVRLEIWPDSGHTPFLEHPRRFQKRLWEFLRL